MTGDEPSFDLSYYFDAALREVPSAPAEMQQAIHYLRDQLDQPTLEDARRLQLLGRIGVYARILGDYTTAAEMLRAAIGLSEQLGNHRAQLVNELRLAHVHQWRGEYTLSNALFPALIARCKQQPALDDYLDFAYQHAGKNAFDQGRYDEALAYFEQAHVLRQQKHDPELLASTDAAIAATCARIAAAREL